MINEYHYYYSFFDILQPLELKHAIVNIKLFFEDLDQLALSGQHCIADHYIGLLLEFDLSHSLFELLMP